MATKCNNIVMTRKHDFLLLVITKVLHDVWTMFDIQAAAFTVIIVNIILVRKCSNLCGFGTLNSNGCNNGLSTLQGLCHRLAVEKGIAHAQLPISDYIDMKTRKVLAINHGRWNLC